MTRAEALSLVIAHVPARMSALPMVKKAIAILESSEPDGPLAWHDFGLPIEEETADPITREFVPESRAEVALWCEFAKAALHTDGASGKVATEVACRMLLRRRRLLELLPGYQVGKECPECAGIPSLRSGKCPGCGDEELAT